jgi:hypothetical protein
MTLLPVVVELANRPQPVVVHGTPCFANCQLTVSFMSGQEVQDVV